MNINYAEEGIANGVSTGLELKYKSNEKKKWISYINIKRGIDLFLALVALILLLPVIGIISLVIKLDSEGTVFFKHTRIGKDGEIIKIYKFRTMVTNAEELIKKFTPEQLEEYKKNFKLENDPRVTKVGKILRKTSLDELPQLLNIIKGNLALIGPRPVVKD